MSNNGFHHEAFNYVWDVDTLSWVEWDGATGASGPAAGAVDQGAAGISPWLVAINGVPHVVIDSATLGTVAVSGPLTDTQLRATPVPVSGTFYQATQPVSGAFYQATQPVSAAALPLPSNAATETGGNLAALVAKDTATSAKQDSGNASLATLTAVNYATAGKQDTAAALLTLIEAKDFATETTLAALQLQGLVSDSADTLSPGTVSPVSLTTDGRLRVMTVSESYNMTPWGSPTAWGSNGLEIEEHPLTTW